MYFILCYLVIYDNHVCATPSPSEELPTSPLPRGKRPATRSGRSDGTASPQNTPKRLCLSSAGSPVRTRPFPLLIYTAQKNKGNT